MDWRGFILPPFSERKIVMTKKELEELRLRVVDLLKEVPLSSVMKADLNKLFTKVGQDEPTTKKVVEKPRLPVVERN
jgi:hypothetical protein